MARNGQTFRKRQREVKLREKAQLKRERREQRKNDKKTLLGADLPQSSTFPSDLSELAPAAGAGPEGEAVLSPEEV